MSTLLVLGYPTEDKAKDVYEKVMELGSDYITNIQSIAVIAKDAKGKFKVDTPGSIVGAGTAWGMFWGMLFGLLFFVPFFGMALGAGMGALFGALEKNGVDKAFQEKVRGMLTDEDSAAVFMVLDNTTEDKFIEALQPYGGDVLKTSLSIDDEEALKKTLSEA